MTYQVYYFSRTGNSERIAKKIATALSCEVYAILDDIDWGGIKAYIKFQAFAKGKKDLQVHSKGNPQEADQIIVVSPIWGSRITPTVKEFIKELDPAKIHLVTTSMMDKTLGGHGYQSLTEIIKSKKNEEEAIAALVENLLR